MLAMDYIEGDRYSVKNNFYKAAKSASNTKIHYDESTR